VTGGCHADKIGPDFQPVELGGHGGWRRAHSGFRLIGAYALSHGVMPEPCGRPPLPSAPGTRGDACERVCWAGKCASRALTPITRSLSNKGGYIVKPIGAVNGVMQPNALSLVDATGLCGGAIYAMSGGRYREVIAMLDDAAVSAADRAARIWSAPGSGPIAPGSEAHKAAFCRMLLDTHNPYKPAIIEWPVLDPDARDRLVSLPIWDIAVQTEGKARLRVLSYAETIDDPLLRRAVELDGFEEGRHKEVLSNLVAAYGIRLAPEAEYRRPRDSEWAFMVTGFSECIDSFFAFGLFALAKHSGFFPPALVETFEPVMQEEGRHILFFVNWVAWHKRNLAVWRRPLFFAKILAVWVFLVWERIGLARGTGSAGDSSSAASAVPQDNNFTLTGGKAVGAVDLSVRDLIDVCLEENERRLSGYDPRLLRPNVVPRLMRLSRRFMQRPKAATTA